jgi:ribulose-phosphate 3-epimerase
MAIICPSVTAFTKQDYEVQLNRVVPLSQRIHIDLMDGRLTTTISPTLEEIWWPAGLQIDIHVMYEQPLAMLDAIISKKPSLVVFHAEAEGDFSEFLKRLKAEGIKVGLAILERTQITQIITVVPKLDHVLIFSGHLGHFGGIADLDLLQKVKTLKANYPNIEVGWDGGINDMNVRALIDGGVDVLNTGGFIQKSDNPAHAYATLKRVAEHKDDDD